MMLQLGEESLYYETIEGDASRPVLVFLHEGLGCAAMWKDFPRRLRRAGV
jgi:pimeloyl-ACP methyl ester carboxylesterase